MKDTIDVKEPIKNDGLKTGLENGPQFPNNDGPEFPNNDGPQLCMREFVITKSMSSTLRAFASQAGFDMYKEFKALSPKKQQQEFLHAKEVQNQAKGLPLLVLKRVSGLGLGDTKYMKIYRGIPSPESRDRLYDDVDKTLFADVSMRTFGNYTRFTLKFDSSEVIVILHNTRSFADIGFGEKKYRFVRGRYESKSHVRSDLYLLPPESESLVDDLTPDKKVKKDNKLVGHSVKKIFKAGSKEVTTGYKCGTLVNDCFVRLKKERKHSTFSILSPVCDFESNDAVSHEDLVLLSASMVLTHHDIEVGFQTT